MTERIGIVGSGTGVGKTAVTLGWVRWLRERGVAAVAWKPIETGGDGDAVSLMQASAGARTECQVLAPAVSPHRAARLCGVEVNFEERRRALVRVSEERSHVLIETAGGAFTPLTAAGATNVELLHHLGVERVVLVARDRLGVLHDVLSVRAALPAQLTLAAVVLSDFNDGAEVAALENAAELRQLLMRIPVVVAKRPMESDALEQLTRACFT